ncbi:hypothetical protein PVM12_21405 [Enterobacter soli]|uniref:hypothetical protein n=1 Tax=Enterobacter soli TaxID=885040 RepID=UPI002378AD8A|nr:hypothetical protein [Enterobacter soli]MDD9246572.1 hypothetical protein [Enterobacter soli]
MLNQTPVLNIGLHIDPGFSGRVLLYIENGVVKGDTPLMADEIIGTPTLFNQLLERAGYRVAPVQKG